jgi:glycosyltransferase EpsD
MYASDICVASSIREGFGINLVEAQYCHLPVIASDNRGHRSVIHNGENGFIVNLDDYIDMSDKVITMLKDKELYRKFSMVDVSRYSSETIAKTVTRYIDELTETI